MLSSIGRAAIRRVVARAGQPTSTNRAFQSVWHLQRVNDADNAIKPSQTLSPFRRSYATSSKTTAAAKPKAKPKPKAKKTVTKSKAKSTKKASLKKKPAKKTVKKAKAKPKAPKKKVLTPEQKEKIAAKKAAEKARTQLKELKATALLPQPKALPSTAWMVFVSEELSGSNSGAPTQVMKQTSEKYKSFSPEKLEQYNHKANQNKATNDINIKKWIESHTPDQIREANNARRLLKRRGVKVPHLLDDARQPKRASNPLGLFVKDRWASGDLRGLKVTDAQKVLVGEWKSLSASERKAYEDLGAADKQRYLQEFKTVFKRDAQVAA